MNNHIEMVRLRAQVEANRQDADLWRWFSDMVEERQIKHVCRGRMFEVVVGPHKTEATSFDEAIRMMKEIVCASVAA